MTNSNASGSSQEGWIGLDIGGANIKLAWFQGATKASKDSDSGSMIESFPFPLWKSSRELASFLIHLLSRFSDVDRIAVTMTGELADCYSNRKNGVHEIVESVEFAIARLSVIRGRAGEPSRQHQVRLPSRAYYYAIGGDSEQIPKHDWLTADEAKHHWPRVAAANWHAIATYASRFLIQNPDFALEPKGEGKDAGKNAGKGEGFLIDIGSTTTDVIPIKSGEPCSCGKEDFSRLKSGELFYAGVGRTPVCSLVDELIVDGHPVSIAREFFATIEDALIVLGLAAENPNDFGTADGRPATKKHARQRLARILCNDSNETNLDFGVGDCSDSFESGFNDQVLDSLAQQVLAQLETKIIQSIRKVITSQPGLPRRFIVSGQGAWLAEKLLKKEGLQFRRLSEVTNESASRSAAAVAVARLAFEELADDREKRLSEISPIAPEQNSKNVPLAIRVVKIGGSLMSSKRTPDLIRNWLQRQEPMLTLWIVGGGNLVESVREFDRRFALNESAAHWICLDLMTLNMRLVQHWFPDWPITHWSESGGSALVNANQNQLLDFASWIRHHQQWNAMVSNQSLAYMSTESDERLTESWEVTSDSCAAYFARSIGANELVLLKSCEIPSEDLACLAAAKIVDPLLPKYASGIPSIRMIQLDSQA